MDAVEVSPKDWLWDENYSIRVVFDDGEYSIIWGKYQAYQHLGADGMGGLRGDTLGKVVTHLVC